MLRIRPGRPRRIAALEAHHLARHAENGIRPAGRSSFVRCRGRTKHIEVIMNSWFHRRGLLPLSAPVCAVLFAACSINGAHMKGLPGPGDSVAVNDLHNPSPVNTAASTRPGPLQIPLDSIKLFQPSQEIPFAWRMLSSRALAPKIRPEAIPADSLLLFREWARQAGARALLIRPAKNGFEVVAVGADPSRAVDGRAVGAAPGGDSSGSASSPSGGCSGSCPVHVGGYTRRDGTYVRPHTRSAPGSRSGGRRH